MYTPQSEFFAMGPPTDIPFAHGTFVRDTPPPEVPRLVSPGYLGPPPCSVWDSDDEEVASVKGEDSDCSNRKAVSCVLTPDGWLVPLEVSEFSSEFGEDHGPMERGESFDVFSWYSTG